MGRLRASVIAIGSAAIACGGGAGAPNLFSTDWLDDGGRSIEGVRQRLGDAPLAPGNDVVVGVARSGARLVGSPLSGGARWTFEHALDARPVVVGRVVVGTGGGELFALDSATGRKLWARASDGASLLGAGDDGTTTVVALADPGGKGSKLVAVGHDGGSVRTIETDKLVGVPAVVRGIAFVPWANQYVTAIDLRSGDELGRVTFREKVSRAWSEGGSLWFGEVGAFRLDANVKNASRGGATHLALPKRDLPGGPRVLLPGTEKLPVEANARDKNRLYAHPIGDASGVAIADDRFYATYYRLVLGFETGKGALSWVHTHPADVLGGDAVAGGLVVCDARGQVVSLDARSGAMQAEVDLGEPLRACVIETDAYHPGGGKTAEPLAVQLSNALLAGDAELVSVHKLLLTELAALADETATKTLVTLAADPRTSPALVKDVRAALAGRKNGASYMLEALDRRYDFLRDVLRPPPVAPLAQALTAMNDKRAAAKLVPHLFEPTETPEDVEEAARAIAVLGGKAESPELVRFLAMYRATATTPDMVNAVASVGEALLRIGSKEGRAAVEEAAGSALTQSAVAERLRAALEAEKAAKEAEKAAKEPAKEPGAKPNPTTTK